MVIADLSVRHLAFYVNPGAQQRSRLMNASLIKIPASQDDQIACIKLAIHVDVAVTKVFLLRRGWLQLKQNAIHQYDVTEIKIVVVIQIAMKIHQPLPP